MSLRVWLPLNGTLENKGLENKNIAKEGTGITTVDGKIGKCFQFPNNCASFIHMEGFNLQTGSWAAWIKVLGEGSAYTQRLMSEGRDSYNDGVEFYTSQNGTTLSFKAHKIILSTSIELNKWYHVVGTFGDNLIKLYINGVLIKSGSYTEDMTYEYSNNRFVLGKMSFGYTGTGTYFPFNGCLNDVRIYDHALSPLEIKEISKGLILHYPLNRGGWGQENLFNWSNNATGITLNDYQNVGSFTQFTNSLSFDPSTTVGKKYTISFWAKSPNGTTSLLLYNSNSKPKYFNFSTTLTSNLGTEWQFFKYTVTNTQYTGSDASTNTSIWKRIEIYAPNKMKVQVKQIKIEEGSIVTPWCPNSSDELATTLGMNDNIEYDCSGFCNNGARTGTFNWTSDTPRYSVSTAFEKGIISIPNSFVTTVDPIFSISLWFKLKSGITYTAYTDLISFSSSSYSNQPFRLELCGTPVGKTIMWFRGPSGQTGGFAVKSDISTDEWYHTALVSEGNKQYSYYVNGEKLGTYNGSANSWTPTGNVSLGENINGVFYESDFRIYATALSADDIKSLYQNSAYIDNHGNVYGAVYEEV